MKTLQSKTPVQFQRTRRADRAVAMTSGRAGKVIPVSYIPILRGDSGSGRISVDLDLAEMPKPLLNGVVANVQAWFVPKSAHAQFASYDEFMASYNNTTIKALGAADRTPPEWCDLSTDTLRTPESSDVYKSLGIHWKPDGSQTLQNDILDAYALIWNFRAAAHSEKIARRVYASENYAQAREVGRAFWPTNRYSHVVSDYEKALITGDLSLDVLAGQVPIKSSDWGSNGTTKSWPAIAGNVAPGTDANGDYDWTTEIFGDMAGQSIGITLADLDKSRQLQSFAALKATYQGTDTTGFVSEDAIMADLMSGLRVPEDEYRRPWLLDSKMVPFGMAERHATDGANLTESVSRGRAAATLSMNLPEQDSGGVILVTVEVVPERIYERQSDEWLYCITPSDFPDALRDVLRVEPVDGVLNRRLDARHATDAATYGFEPLNTKWQRDFTRLGGAFYQADPANPFTEQRSALWLPNIVNPDFTEDHYLVPESFPHDVFSDTLADAFEAVVRHEFAVSGLTQFGDVLHENNSEYTELTAENPA